MSEVVDPPSLADGVRQGDRRALAQAITLIESSRPEDRPAASGLLDLLSPHAGNSIRVGISGVPGVGKSTFIESLGNHVIDAGHRVAVLAVDPSSAISGGSILGDKTRMERLSRRTEAYIRPSPAGGTLGGVTRRTRETMIAVEAAGFDVVLVETVGVGQSETAVAEMTDMFVLLLLPGGGDELQGIKRGIVELADLILVNKADGDLAPAAQRAAVDYSHALKFLHPRSAYWEVPVETCSAINDQGTARAWELIESYRDAMSTSEEFERRRASQARSWLWSETSAGLLAALREDAVLHAQMEDLEAAVMAGEKSPSMAAEEIIEVFRK